MLCVQFITNADYEAAIDNIRILADDLETTTTYTYANNNEMSTMADGNGTINFYYDAWGRTLSKTRGGKTATYGWGENHKLVSVDSDFPDEGDVDYAYGGDRLRREREEEDGTPYFLSGKKESRQRKTDRTAQRHYGFFWLTFSFSQRKGSFRTV